MNNRWSIDKLMVSLSTCPSFPSHLHEHTISFVSVRNIQRPLHYSLSNINLTLLNVSQRMVPDRKLALACLKVN